MLKLCLWGELGALVTKILFLKSKSACHVVGNAKNSKNVNFLAYTPILITF